MDIYEVVALALHYGITLDNLKDITFTTLLNLLDASLPQEHEPTQEEINTII